jgi:hypothetical protein
MNIEELVPLTNGLSVVAGPHTLVCDRARITPTKSSTAVDVSFWIAGTDFVPRLRLTRERIARSTADEVAGIVRKVACGAITGERHASPR